MEVLLDQEIKEHIHSIQILISELNSLGVSFFSSNIIFIFLFLSETLFFLFQILEFSFKEQFTNKKENIINKNILITKVSI